MHVVLVGPEIEENLALRSIHASLLRAGHRAEIADFHHADQIPGLAQRLADAAPDLVGLSMLYTSRSREFLSLAEALRAVGFAGHLTAGGHFASLTAPDLLAAAPALDTVVHGEGEEGLVDLLAGLDDPGSVRGVSLRAPSGAVVRTGRRPNPRDLDARPWPTRPERFHGYLGRPIASLLSSRGCHASCAFCSISAWHADNGGPRYRLRRPEAVADEVAWLYHERGVRILNFQDDNFLSPSLEANLRRLRSLREAFAARGVGRVAIQVKARPDSMDPELLDLLVEMGLFRLFLGVETDAVTGLETLARGCDRATNHRAVTLLRERELHACFNLLLFDPDATTASVRESLAFMARQDWFPLNFCRTEVYAGTPIEARLRREGRLLGDFTGRCYRMEPAAQRAFEVFVRVFTPRNFATGGMHHESMKVDYLFHLLRFFHPELAGRALERRVKGLVHDLNRHSALLMGQICDLADAGPIDPRLVQALSRERVRFDQQLAAAFAEVTGHVERLARAPGSRRRHYRVKTAAAAAMLAMSLGCPQDDTHMCEMAPPPLDESLEVDLSEQVQQRFLEAHRADLEASAFSQLGVDLRVRAGWWLGIDGRSKQLDFVTVEPAAPALEQHVTELIASSSFQTGREGRVEMDFTLRGQPTHMVEMVPSPVEPTPEPQEEPSLIPELDEPVVEPEPVKLIGVPDKTHMCEMAPPPNWRQNVTEAPVPVPNTEPEPEEE